MKVYIVMRCYPYEGAEVEKVFTNPYKAAELSCELNESPNRIADYCVEEHEVEE